MAYNPLDSVGTDVSTFVNGLPDLDPMFNLISGRRLLVEAAARRLMTDPVFTRDDRYGLNLRKWASARMTPVALAKLNSSIRGQLLLDERILDVQVTTRLDQDKLVISVEVLGDDGPFEFTVLVSSVAVELVNGFV